MRKLISLVALLMLSLSLFEARGFTSKVKERPTLITIKQMPDWTEQPLEIVGVRVGKRSVAIGKSFQADDAWLKDLTVTVRNVSQAPIVGFDVGVQFQKDLNGEEALFPIEIRRGIDYSMGQTEGEKIVLRPGETMSASVEISWYESAISYAKQLTNLPEDILNKVSLRLIYAGYSSDNIWVRGNHMHRKDAMAFVTDEAYRKKMRVMAKLMREQQESNGLERYGLRKASYKPVPHCLEFDGTQFSPCPPCPDCMANEDQYHQVEADGWSYTNARRGCQKVVGGQWVACGCGVIVDQINIGIPDC